MVGVVDSLSVDGEVVYEGGTDFDNDLVLLRFAPDGDLLDQAEIGHGSLKLRDIGIDAAGRVVVSGTIYGPGGGDLGSGLTVPDDTATFVASYTPELAHAWSHAYGDESAVADMDVHPDGHIALLGSFRGELDFGNTSTSTPFPSLDLFVVKLAADGSDLWSRHIWGDANLGAGAVAFDPLGYVVVGGTAYNGVLRIGSFRAEVFGGGIAMFLTRLGTNSGSIVWASVYRGTGQGVAPADIAVPWNARRFYVVGYFSGSVNLGDDRGPMVGDDGSDFIARMVR